MVFCRSKSATAQRGKRCEGERIVLDYVERLHPSPALAVFFGSLSVAAHLLYIIP
jgi:hypothetical protein